MFYSNWFSNNYEQSYSCLGAYEDMLNNKQTRTETLPWTELVTSLREKSYQWPAEQVPATTLVSTPSIIQSKLHRSSDPHFFMCKIKGLP